MVLRTDSKTKKQYTYFNMPIGENTSLYNCNGFYIIMNENRLFPDDSWENGRFIGDRYAVFKWVNTSVDTGYFQQVTKWYKYFGWAKNKLYKIFNS